MSSQTTNLHLIKPADGEIADIGVINSNMDVIDSSVLPLTGGTLTGELTVVGDNLYIRSNEIDRDGSNPSGSIFGRSFFHLDKDSERIGLFQPMRDANGTEWVRITATNEVSGSNSDNNIYIGVKNDGTKVYSVSDQAAFRTAIGANSSGVWDASQIPTLATSKISGLGAEVSNDISTAVSIASGSWKTLGTIDLTTGKWIVMAGVRFASASAGYRYISLSDTSNASPSDLYRRLSQVCVGAASGTETTIRTTVPIQVTGTSWTCRANVYQNCGSALNCTGRIRAYRIA